MLDDIHLHVIDDLAPVMVRPSWCLDDRLSLAARGLLLTLSAGDPSQTMTNEWLASSTSSDDAGIAAAVTELLGLGYLIASESGGPLLLVDPHAPPARPSAPVADLPTRPPRDHDCVIYFAQRANGDVKIGFSKQHAKRLRTLALDHGPLALLGTEPGGWHREQEVHRRFARWRVEREWFSPSKPLMRYVKALPDRHDEVAA